MIQAATAPPIPPPIAAPFDEVVLATAVAEGVKDEGLVVVREDRCDDGDGDEVGTNPVVCARITGAAVAEAPTPLRTRVLVC